MVTAIKMKNRGVLIRQRSTAIVLWVTALLYKNLLRFLYSGVASVVAANFPVKKMARVRFPATPQALLRISSVEEQ